MSVTVTEKDTDTLASTGSSTEDTVITETSAGVFRLYIDLSNLQGVDARVTVREYMKLASAGSYKLINTEAYNGLLLEVGGGSEGPMLELPTRDVLYGYKVTLTDSGSTKNFLWLEHEIG